MIIFCSVAILCYNTNSLSELILLLRCMTREIRKFIKFSALGLFFMALFFNIKISLTDPFNYSSGEVIAQTSSSSSSSGGYSCFAEIICDDGGKLNAPELKTVQDFRD